MSRVFSASRLRRGASFRRLTGVSVTAFDEIPKQLRDEWDAAQSRKRKPRRS